MAEQTSRLADIEALTGGVRWRWGMICVGAVLLQLAHSSGLSELTPWLIVIFVAVGVVANLSLLRLLQVNSHRWWLTYFYCLIDVLLISIAIVYLGPGSTVAGFFLVIIPCAMRPDRKIALFALSAASVGYLIAASVHGLLSSIPEGGTFGLPSSVIFDLVFFAAVAITLVATLTKLFGRIAIVHSVIDSATDGSLESGTLDNRNDLLGQLGRSLQTMLKDVASTIEVVRNEAAEVATLAELFAQSTRKAEESRRQVASMTTGLAQEFGELQAISEAGHTESTAVAQEAINLQSRAQSDEGDALAFEETVQRGRDRVVRTSETLLAIGADINRTTNIVDELGGLSRQIGSSALSIAKVARHTHVLALNAAIEAARAEEHGKEFAVVADQVRTLAGEAGRSARDVGNLIGEVQAGILAAENALLAGKDKINDVGVIVGEARSALTDLRSGASNASNLVSTTVETSQAQAKIAGSLSGKMSQLIETSTRWSVDIAETAQTMSAQGMALNELSQTSQRLADLAERLQVQAAPHSTPRKK